MDIRLILTLISGLAPTISFGILGGGPFGEPVTFVLIIGALMAVFDVVYIFMPARSPGKFSPAT